MNTSRFMHRNWVAFGLFVITAAAAQAGDTGKRSSPFLTLGVAEGLPEGEVWSVYPAKDGGVWIGTDAGLVRYREKDGAGRFENVSKRIGLGKVAVRTVLEDRKGAVWIGTHTQGLFRWRNGELTRFDRARGLSGNSIHALVEDSTGRVWIGTDAGLNAVLKDDLYLLPKDIVNLGPVTMSSILLDRSGRIWIATYNRGVLRLDGSKVHRYGLGSEMRVTTLIEDSDGSVWLGTTAGLGRLRDGEFTVLGAGHSPIDGPVLQVFEDARRQLWITTRRGLFSVERWQLEDFMDREQSGKPPTFRSYGGADGLRAVEFNGGYATAGAFTEDGRLWLPASGALVVYDPAAADAMPPPVVESNDGGLDRWLRGGPVLHAGLGGAFLVIVLIAFARIRRQE